MEKKHTDREMRTAVREATREAAVRERQKIAAYLRSGWRNIDAYVAASKIEAGAHLD